MFMMIWLMGSSVLNVLNQLIRGVRVAKHSGIVPRSANLLIGKNTSRHARKPKTKSNRTSTSHNRNNQNNNNKNNKLKRY